MMKKLVISLFSLTLLAACGKQFATNGDLDSPAIPTSEIIGPTNPQIITNLPDDDEPLDPSSPVFEPPQADIVTPPAATPSQLVLGFISVSQAKIQYVAATKQLIATGTLIKKNSNNRIEWQHEFTLKGTVGEDGFANSMMPSSDSSPDFTRNLRARGMCLEDGDFVCPHAVVDIVYREDESRAHGLQIETKNKMPTTPVVVPNVPAKTDPKKPVTKPSTKPAPTPPKKEVKPPVPATKPATPTPPIVIEDEGDIDDSLKPDLYIGTLHEDWRDLYDNKPVTTSTTTTTIPAATAPPPATKPPVPATEPKPTTPVATPTTSTTLPPPTPTSGANDVSRPMDQAIGPPHTIVQGGVTSRGSLKNGTYFITENNKTEASRRSNLYLPGDDHLYGTWELVQLLKAMAAYAIDLKTPMYVGDLSKKTGGLTPPHASHQNGLDVDVGFPFTDAKKWGGTPTVLTSGKQLAPGFRARETYALFKYAASMDILNLIFVHPVVKAALCKEAVTKGELSADGKSGKALDLMSRIRPEVNHYKHFHIRIRCSKYQRKCRKMTEPAKVSGCAPIAQGK